jgi:hypothetical protein
VNRAERRAAARSGKWADTAANFRKLAELDKVLSLNDRRALTKAAGRLDAGESPLRVMASVAPVLDRVRKATTARRIR